jgi:ketosteroid isomerase-like protein
MDEESRRRDKLIEWVNQGFEDFANGDVEAVLARYSPDIEIYSAPGVGNEGTFHGHRGYLGWAAQWFEAWDEFHQVPTRTEVIGSRHVLAEVQQSARGRGSGVPIERRLTYLFDVPGDLVTAMHLYASWEDAVTAAGAREAAMNG